MPDDYAANVVGALLEAVKHADQRDPGHTEAIEAMLRAVEFIRRRLTNAAIEGCHHCDEGPSGEPCWWCGLKNPAVAVNQE